MRRLTWLVALGTAATVMGLLAAPQLVLVVARLAGLDAPPSTAVQLLALAAYECGLWGSGLAVWFVAQRLGWLAGRGFAAATVVSPLAGEAAYWHLVDRATTSPGLASPMGLAVRLVVGAGAVVVALWSVRARPRPAAPPAGEP